MMANFWFKLLRFLPLCAWFAVLSVLPYTTFAYDGQSKTRVAYDTGGESSIRYDAVFMLATGEKKNGTAGDRVLFAKFPEFLAAKNVAIREGYLDALKSIPGKIDTTLPLREQAMQAFNLRNAAKIDARAAMADGGALLNKTDPIPTIQDVVRRAYQDKGLVGDDMWRSILESSTRSRTSVNQALGVGQ